MNAPVLFLVFNRPETTARVFEAIRRAKPERLYVAADGPRPDSPSEVQRCAMVRDIATSVDWPCELQTLFRETNLGCRAAVSGAISWFFDHEPEGIILEDDCLPHPSFFPYCAALLERYRDQSRVMCITGNNFLRSMGDFPYSYYFSIYNHIWGWASWRRAWQFYDTDLKSFDRTSARPLLDRLSSVPGFADYWLRNLTGVQEGQIDTWDYAWTWTCWAHGGLTCTPRVNLVSNIGFGLDATHTFDNTSIASRLPVQALRLPLSAPPGIEASEKFDNRVTTFHFGLGLTHWTRLTDVRRIRRLLFAPFKRIRANPKN